ncbi:Actin-interacting protein 1 [Aphelenchoides avenae]|nr:Actin-interacting protein 1 [Aphelenchus avenae]
MSAASEYEKVATFASLPRTTRGLPLVLSASPDGNKFLYCNGNSVYIRDADNIADCDIYTEHSTLTTVAKYAPSGFYVASGDQSGKVRIWDTTQVTHILKAEYPVISGPIRDIAWSDDSKRVAVVGEGRERFGHVFLFDTGTSNGNLSGQSRPMSSIDFRPARPYRLVSASEDNTLFREHNRFVHSVRYNKDGSFFASAGADGKARNGIVVLYEGTEGAKVGEFLDEKCKEAAHDGGVFAITWSPDGQKLASASGDKTVKIWDVASRSLQNTINFGTGLEDQQLAVVWLNKLIVSVSLAGFVNYVDPETWSISKMLKGHNKPITAVALSQDKKFIFTADFEGHIARWDAASGESVRLSPAVHRSQVSGLVLTPEGTLISTAWDDTLAFTEGVLANTDNLRVDSQKLPGQPRGVSATPDGEKVVVATHKSVLVFNKRKQTASMDTRFEATCVALHPSKGIVAVGAQDNKVRVYDVSDSALSEKKVLQHNGAITALSWSPDGRYLVATDAGRKVIPYDSEADFKSASEKEWTFHTARVNAAAWSPNSRYVATGGLDTNIMIYDLKNSGEHPIVIKGAHAMSPVNGIVWLSDTRVVSVGQDSNVKQFDVNV